jgi:hypothetical protein
MGCGETSAKTDVLQLKGITSWGKKWANGNTGTLTESSDSSFVESRRNNSSIIFAGTHENNMARSNERVSRFADCESTSPRLSLNARSLECNCFNASRFYCADVRRVVKAVSDYQVQRYAADDPIE